MWLEQDSYKILRLGFGETYEEKNANEDLTTKFAFGDCRGVILCNGDGARAAARGACGSEGTRRTGRSRWRKRQSPGAPGAVGDHHGVSGRRRNPDAQCRRRR